MNRTRKEVVPAGKPVDRWHPLETGEVRITTFVPLQFKRRGIKKVVVGPAGVDKPVKVSDPTPAISPNQDPALLRALGRALYWRHLLDTGVVADTAEIAEREGLHRTFVNDHLRNVADEIIAASVPPIVGRLRVCGNNHVATRPRHEVADKCRFEVHGFHRVCLTWISDHSLGASRTAG